MSRNVLEFKREKVNKAAREFISPDSYQEEPPVDMTSFDLLRAMQIRTRSFLVGTILLIFWFILVSLFPETRQNNLVEPSILSRWGHALYLLMPGLVIVAISIGVTTYAAQYRILSALNSKGSNP